MADDFDYINRTYGVAARRGGVVVVDGKPGAIVGAINAHVRIRLQGDKHAHPYHPRDPRIVYEPRAAGDKVDGLGNVIADDMDYYVQDARGYVGNCVSWWRPAGAGYTCDIDDAGIYKGKAVRSMRDTDVPWPMVVVTRNVSRFVDMQRLRHERETADAIRGAQ